MESQDRYTLSYRADEARQIMEWIKAGQCGCIVGLPGVGKSNFMQFLFQPSVRSHYLGQQSTAIVMVLVDLLSLTEVSNWAIYELIINRLVIQLRYSGADEAIVDKLSVLHQEVASKRDFLIAQRAVEQCVDIISLHLNRRIVLFFDEFDSAFQTCDPSLFRCLRAVRDAHKENVSYLVSVANEIINLRDNLGDSEYFYRLVSYNLCYLAPYNETDARQTIAHLAAQRINTLTEQDVARLVDLSGGHAGLLITIFSRLFSRDYEGNLAKLEAKCSYEKVIQLECQKIWDSLLDVEQVALLSVVNKEPVDSQIHHQLQIKGMVRKDDPFVVFSPVFVTFVRQHTPPPRKGLYISRSPQIVQLDGQRITLSELEFELLCYLYERRGKICTKNDLIENIYRQRYMEMFDAPLQTLISRLREKIEPDRARPRYVVTVRGEGYRYVQPDDE